MARNKEEKKRLPLAALLQEKSQFLVTYSGDCLPVATADPLQISPTLALQVF